MPAETTGSNLLTTCIYASAERNYSMLYDKSTYTAYWVAYPLVTSQTGGTRNGTWKKAPGIDATNQINVWDGSYGVNYGSDTYARGHQIPDGDRSGTSSMQTQTYYATNSTPQIQNGFNGGIWNKLEDGVRSVIPASDTLYVTTGAIFRTKSGNETINYIIPQHDAKQCPVPNYYYKVLLKCKRDVSGAIIDASAVGVWFEHKSYSNTGDTWSNYVKSVAEIEQLTGYDFFVNVPSDIASTAERNSSWETFKAF